MKIVNRKFGREYEELERFEAGIMLTGPEVKSIRAEKLKLDDAFVKIIGDELFLINAEIYPNQYAPADMQEPTRTRKLLLNKAEVTHILVKMKGGRGLTLAPVNCHTKGSLIKLDIALVRGRKDLEKRKREKARDMARNEKREAKEFTKR